MAERVAQLAHRAFRDADEIGVGGKPRQQPALGAERIARRDGVLNEIAALDQRVQVPMHRAFGDD